MPASLADKLIAALEKRGPSSPRVLADHIGEEPDRIKYQLGQLVKAGKLKAHGATLGRLYALPVQKFPNGAPKAPPPVKAARATPRANGRAGFIPALTAERELVVIEDSALRLHLTHEQTLKLADLILDNFEA
jgi:hypothetical protein